MNAVFEHSAFSASRQRVEDLTRIILAHPPRQRPPAILEIGCADGTQLVRLAGALPGAIGTGVDISGENIARAMARVEAAGLADRVRCLVGDYGTLDLPGVFDVIVADSVFHLMGAAPGPLFAKVAAHLAPGGRLFFTMPYTCTFNRLLWMVRGGLRRIRGPWLDGLVFQTARFLHPKMNKSALLERVVYMYLQPSIAYGPAVNRLLTQQAALVQFFEQPMRHASLAQPKHKIFGFRRP